MKINSLNVVYSKYKINGGEWKIKWEVRDSGIKEGGR